MTSPVPTAPGRPLGAHDPVALGEYSLLRRLGEGGMGTVYLGRSRAGRMVAVKVIRPEFAQVEEFRVRFVRETASAQRVARFCTAEVLDVDADGDMPYLVTEFVEGETLAQVVAESGPLTAANLERLAVGMAAALTAIHGAGIVHRDLKPGNVMLSPFGPRVIDFGIARASDAALGMTQIRVGTPAFMAPEQVMGEALTPALDVFAWGATVAYAGTGRLPFGDDADRLFYRILNGAPDLDGLRGNGFLHPIVERALSKDPTARPASNELLLSLLGGAGKGATALGDPEAAVTRAMVGWSPPLDEPATVLPGSQTTTAAGSPPIVAPRPSAVPPPPGGGRPRTVAAPEAAPGPTVPEADRPADPQRTPYHPPTAATALPNWPQPTSSQQRQPEWSPPTSGRPAAAPPSRPDGTPSFTEPAAPQGRRRGRIVAVALVAAVVVAALVIGGIQLFGGDADTGPAANGTGGATGSSGAPGPMAIPRSDVLSGNTIVVDRTDGGGHRLFRVAADGSGEEPLGDDTAKQLPVLSPDRRTVAYVVSADGSLGLMAADGSGDRPLLVGDAAGLTPCADGRVAWNPDSTQVALCATGPDGAGLFVVDPAAGTYRKLPAPEQVGDPAWSPDGRTILYRSGGSADGGPLAVVAADGSGQPRQLTDGVDAQPAWAPNGQHITFRRQVDGGGFDIVGTRADGTGFFDFTEGSAAADSDPSYSPGPPGGGEQIVFVSDRDGTPQLYLFDPADRPTVVTPVPGQNGGSTSPSWSTGPAPG